MNIKVKCDYGYAKRHLIVSIITSTVLLGLSLGVYFLGIHIYGSNKNLLTLIAVLGMLPAAKEIVNLIMCIRAYKYICSDKLHASIEDILNGAENPYIRYDLYVTAYENTFPIMALTCFEDSIIGYSNVKEFKHNKFEEHVKTLLTQNGLKVATIKIFDNEDKFLDRIKTFATSEKETTDKEYKVIRLMENLSL